MSDVFELPEKYLELQAQARELATSCADISERADESDQIDPEMRQRLKDSGLPDVMVAAEYGGRFDRVDSLAATVVREQLAYESAHLDSIFCMQGIGSYAISVGGSDRVRKTWLPQVGNLDAIAALALTEPAVGSDLKSITTTVVEHDGELVVNGHKSFITNAGDAAFYSVLAKEGGEMSLIFVPTDTPGVSVTHPHQIIAPHVIGDVMFDNVRVPLDHRLGEPGKGFKLMLATLATFRVSVAGAAVGVAQAALDEAVRHTTAREQFGVPLWRLGGMPASLASSWIDIEMTRTLAYRAASAAARDPLGALHLSSMAKVAATEAAGRVVDRAVQSMGRFGLVRGSKIERLYRDARPMRIYEGSTEVIYDSLAKKLVRDFAS
ncbi:MAG: acyl-CoA dehydrogenase [Pseudonocardiales bacterium]|nr:acyl-CoA dehydrogenase [Pseudonocardiales bacterium]